MWLPSLRVRVYENAAIQFFLDGHAALAMTGMLPSLRVRVYENAAIQFFLDGHAALAMTVMLLNNEF